MAGKVSMDDIAKELGISKNTVSLVFRGFPGINIKTREKVLEAATKMGYTYSRSKSGDVTIQPVAGILIVIPFSAKNSFSFFSYVQFGIESEAKRNNLSTIISYYNDVEGLTELPLCIREGQVSGIITIGRIKQEVYSLLKNSGLPVVMADHYYEDLSVECVLSDNFCGGFMAVKHLLSKGHSQIGFIGDINDFVSFYDRFIGYQKALESCGIVMHPEYIINKNYEFLLSEGMPSVISTMISKKALPSAVFCCNDIMAITFMKGLNSIGMKVPDDISVIGFDDIDLSSNFFPELTTIRVEKELMGITAIRRLIDLLNENNSVPLKTIMSVTLTERRSVKLIDKAL